VSVLDRDQWYSSSIGIEMVDIQRIRIVIEREDDGLILASVPELPGVMAYGASDEEAMRKVKSIALQVLAADLRGGAA
jgi:predicted RNase H-like HicB family nuclease